jgi:hypothetical protein
MRRLLFAVLAYVHRNPLPRVGYVFEHGPMFRSLASDGYPYVRFERKGPTRGGEAEYFRKANGSSSPAQGLSAVSPSDVVN